jgi:hypothetical protein
MLSRQGSHLQQYATGKERAGTDASSNELAGVPESHDRTVGVTCQRRAEVYSSKCTTNPTETSTLLIGPCTG